MTPDGNERDRNKDHFMDNKSFIHSFIYSLLRELTTMQAAAGYRQDIAAMNERKVPTMNAIYSSGKAFLADRISGEKFAVNSRDND